MSMMNDKDNQQDAQVTQKNPNIPSLAWAEPPEAFSLIDLFTGQRLLWGIAWVLGIATVLSVLGLVMLAGWFITMAGVAGAIAAGGHAFNYLMPSAIIRGFAIVRTVARYGDLMVSHHAIFGLLKDLRVRFFSHWARLPLSVRMSSEGMTKSSSDTMQRLVRDIDVLDEFPLRVVSPLIVAIVACMVLSVFLLIHVSNALISVVCMVLSVVFALLTLRRGILMAQEESRIITLRKNTLLNTLPALTSLLTWGRWQDKVVELSELDAQYLHHATQVMTLKRRAQACINLTLTIGVVALLALVGRYFERTDITPFSVDTLNDYTSLNPAIILALTLGMFGLMEIVSGLVAEPLTLGKSLQAKHRVNALMGMVGDKSKQPLMDKPIITLSDVSVKMPTAIMGADGIHATLGCDKPTLIIGASGAGKSTLLATLAGEIPIVGGNIHINGVDYQDIDFGQSLGFLGQNVDIFDQTLADNLRLGKPSADDEELWEVLDKVGLLTWASSQPKGLDTPLGEYGMAISGGQGRRVALARLLLVPKKILLLDEPFAGLDSSTRHQVWQSLVDMQAQGKIGVLAIATHQVWHEMGNVEVIRV